MRAATYRLLDLSRLEREDTESCSLFCMRALNKRSGRGCSSLNYEAETMVPGPKHSPQFRKDHRLSDWPNCNLELRCEGGCGRTVIPPLTLLLRELGDTTFAEMLPKLRCRQCRRKPAPIFLCASFHRSHCGGPAPDWAIEIVGAPPSPRA